MNNSKVKNPVRKKSTPHGEGNKGRSLRTNQNKLRKLKSFYEGVFKRSQEVKQSKKYPNKIKYFCDRFITFDSYLKMYSIKEVKDRR